MSSLITCYIQCKLAMNEALYAHDALHLDVYCAREINQIICLYTTLNLERKKKS